MKLEEGEFEVLMNMALDTRDFDWAKQLTAQQKNGDFNKSESASEVELKEDPIEKTTVKRGTIEQSKSALHKLFLKDLFHIASTPMTTTLDEALDSVSDLIFFYDEQSDMAEEGESQLIDIEVGVAIDNFLQHGNKGEELDDFIIRFFSDAE